MADKVLCYLNLSGMVANHLNRLLHSRFFKDFPQRCPQRSLGERCVTSQKMAAEETRSSVNKVLILPLSTDKHALISS